MQGEEAGEEGVGILATLPRRLPRQLFTAPRRVIAKVILAPVSTPAAIIRTRVTAIHRRARGLPALRVREVRANVVQPVAECLLVGDLAGVNRLRHTRERNPVEKLRLVNLEARFAQAHVEARHAPEALATHDEDVPAGFQHAEALIPDRLRGQFGIPL